MVNSRKCRKRPNFDFFKFTLPTTPGTKKFGTVYIIYKLSFDGRTTASAASSNHPHEYTSLGKLSSGLVAVSGYQSGVEVELFSAHAWSRQPDFPESSYFYLYSTATVADALFIFGE